MSQILCEKVLSCFVNELAGFSKICAKYFLVNLVWFVGFLKQFKYICVLRRMVCSIVNSVPKLRILCIIHCQVHLLFRIDFMNLKISSGMILCSQDENKPNRT